VSSQAQLKKFLLPVMGTVPNFSNHKNIYQEGFLNFTFEDSI